MRKFKWQYAWLRQICEAGAGFTTCLNPWGRPSTIAETMLTKTVRPASYGIGARHARARRADPMVSATSASVLVSGSSTSTTKRRCSLRKPTICTSPGPSRHATFKASRILFCSGKSRNIAPITAVSHATSAPQPMTSTAAARNAESTGRSRKRRAEKPVRLPQSSQTTSWKTSLFGSGARPGARPRREPRSRRCSNASCSGAGGRGWGGARPTSSA
mmetsp:Transcript_75191/g.244502  ORF Transcript_75191/g.244502 Transcript_75191/m.244502 type:complete len:217 (-) Transcript_75191:717-1367(-)